MEIHKHEPQSITHIHGTIKQHKHQTPVRSIVKRKDSLGYKLAKLIDILLKDTTQLPNVYNIQNSTNLSQNLKDIYNNENIKHCVPYHKCCGV